MKTIIENGEFEGKEIQIDKAIFPVGFNAKSGEMEFGTTDVCGKKIKVCHLVGVWQDWRRV